MSKFDREIYAEAFVLLVMLITCMLIIAKHL